MERIKSIVNIHGVDGLEELANVSHLFGQKAGDRGLIMYIRTWIKLCLKPYMMASLSADSTEEEERDGKMGRRR